VPGEPHWRGPKRFPGPLAAEGVAAYPADRLADRTAGSRGRRHIVGDPEWAHEILQAGRAGPQQLTHMILETQMIRRRGPLLVASVQSDPRVHQPLAAATLSRSYVAAPIMSQGRVIGFLHADCYVQRRHVDEFDRDVLWMFAQAFGYAFERSVLRERLHSLRIEVGRLTGSLAGR